VFRAFGSMSTDPLWLFEIISTERCEKVSKKRKNIFWLGIKMEKDSKVPNF